MTLIDESKKTVIKVIEHSGTNIIDKLMSGVVDFELSLSSLDNMVVFEEKGNTCVSIYLSENLTCAATGSVLSIENGTAISFKSLKHWMTYCIGLYQ